MFLIQIRPEYLRSNLAAGLGLGLSLVGVRSWTPFIPLGEVWTDSVAVTVEAGHVGSLTNVVQATSVEGASRVYTQSLMVGCR